MLGARRALARRCVPRKVKNDLTLGVCELSRTPQGRGRCPGPAHCAALGAPGMALTLRGSIGVFYDLEMAQIRILQEEGQDKSVESKATEKPPDTLLMEVEVLDKVKLEMCCSLLASTITPI